MTVLTTKDNYQRDTVVCWNFFRLMLVSPVRRLPRSPLPAGKTARGFY